MWTVDIWIKWTCGKTPWEKYIINDLHSECCILIISHMLFFLLHKLKLPLMGLKSWNSTITLFAFGLLRFPHNVETYEGLKRSQSWGLKWGSSEVCSVGSTGLLEAAKISPLMLRGVDLRGCTDLLSLFIYLIPWLSSSHSVSLLFTFLCSFSSF